MKVISYVCDICHIDGEKRKAVAVYFPEGEEMHVCKRHLELVKQAKVSWESITEEEAIA